MRRMAGLGLAACVLAAGDPALAGGWRLTVLDGAPAVSEPEIRFGPEGRIAVATGCNRLILTARTEDAVLVPEGPVAATRMACSGALGRQEEALLALFGDRVTMIYDPFTDGLALEGSGVVAVLERAAPGVPDGPAPGVDTPLWQPHAGREPPSGDPLYLSVFGMSEDLPVRAGSSAESEALGGVPSGTVLRNAGCEEGWCAVDLPDGSLSGWAEAAYLEPAGSGLRAGQAIYDATASVSCALGQGNPMAPCAAGVARDSGGTATVVVLRRDGLQRTLFFDSGAFTGTDASGADIGARRVGDTLRVRVDAEILRHPRRLPVRRLTGAFRRVRPMKPVLPPPCSRLRAG